MSALIVSPRIVIPEDELDESFIRSAGPGGQNVNKVASAVQLRFDVAGSPSLPEPVRAALAARERLTREGVLVITARRFREQEKNRADARARLVEIIRRAAVPRRARHKTKVPRASKAKRLESKKHRGRVKQQRGRIPD
ncbi:MAG: aminoacyl-tRNA hydrolase [Alphaproteobacteria bacterium 64-11]|nr:aminoacyl-tRNA hydrolase [Alphaproteobacteria bacterium]OJU08643.1 MAG: aminoacyl-tRNA hydrolase [Alphaproteobacteria bacterium 64-11]